MAEEQSLGFGLLVGHKKPFKNAMHHGKLWWAFLTFYCLNDQFRGKKSGRIADNERSCSSNIEVSFWVESTRTLLFLNVALKTFVLILGGDFAGLLPMTASCWGVYLLSKQQLCSLHLLRTCTICVWTGDPANVCWRGCPLRSPFRLIVDRRRLHVSGSSEKPPGVCGACVCASEYVVWLCAHVRRPAGVSAVEECETDGERSLTDGGIVPITQFMLECCTEREKKGERRGRHLCFRSAMCWTHVGLDSGNREDFSKQACRWRSWPGPTWLCSLHN